MTNIYSKVAMNEKVGREGVLIKGAGFARALKVLEFQNKNSRP